jgi:pimeloyl-[acyl-carrier protein] methyl ester esterase
MDGSGALFAPFIAALGDAVDTIVVAYPTDVPLDYAGLTAFARERLPRDRPFYLLGESFSGPIAIALAAASPPGLQGLILSCSFARNPVPLLRAARPLISILPVSHHFAPLLHPFMLGLGQSGPVRKVLRAALAAVPPTVVKARMRTVLDVDYTAPLAAIVVPVLYLQASRDRVVSVAALRHIRSIKADVKVVTIDGPHLLLQMAPRDAAGAVLGFIAGLAGKD